MKTASVKITTPRISILPDVPNRFVLQAASRADRDQISILRHQVYADEIGQHPPHASGRLTDSLDEGNVFLTVAFAGQIMGFVSITPPTLGHYSIDKYFERQSLPFEVNSGLWEIRLLTVLTKWRNQPVAAMLMLAAFRWVESHGGLAVTAIGRREVLPIYLKSGMAACGLEKVSGKVHYSLLYQSVANLRSQLDGNASLLDFLESKMCWELPFALRRPATCFHGGAFFSAIGEDFSDLKKREKIINADVLDAWFPPAPEVILSLSQDMPWLLRTSPPTDGCGLIRKIALMRAVAPENILLGAGSSDLIFRAFREWLSSESRVLILDPTYGEYAHVLEKVIRCRVDRLQLRREEGFCPLAAGLKNALRKGYDLVVVVNPNSPTGVHVKQREFERILQCTSPQTRVWVDETYIEYAGIGQSLESVAAWSENVIVCKSMSKVYGLSGARVAYLCAGAHQIESLRAITPPWVVGLLSQLAAVRALESTEYYAQRYAETHCLRRELVDGLSELGMQTCPGVANFVLSYLPDNGPTAAVVVEACRSQGVFLRDAQRMGTALGSHAIRIAVKSAEENKTMLQVLRRSMGVPSGKKTEST